MYVVISKNSVEYFKRPKITTCIPTYIKVFDTSREASNYCLNSKKEELYICEIIAESSLVTPNIKYHK